MIHNLRSAYSLPANHDTSENCKCRKHERNPKTSKGDDSPGLLALADFPAEKRFWRGNINAANMQAYRQTLNSIPITP